MKARKKTTLLWNDGRKEKPNGRKEKRDGRMMAEKKDQKDNPTSAAYTANIGQFLCLIFTVVG